MNTTARRWLPIAVAVGIAFYIGVYFWGTHSDGYKFLDQAVRKSPVIQQRVGEVQSIRMSFFGGYRERYIDSDKWMTTTLNVAGSKGTVTVKAAAKESNGTWRVSEASMNGEPISLN